MPKVGGVPFEGGWVPQPDPTKLTIELLNREIHHLLQLQDRDVRYLFDLNATQDEVRDERLKGIEARLAAITATYTAGHAALVSVVDANNVRLSALETLRMAGKQSSTTVVALVGIGLTVVYLVTNIVLALMVHH